MRLAPFALVLAACSGGSGDSGEPLVAGSIQASYAGTAFTADAGFATLYMDRPLIGFGDGNVHCGSEDSPNPPTGHSIIVKPPAFDPGTYTTVFVDLIDNTSGFQATGSQDGILTITASGDTIAGNLTYAFTDADNKTYTATGDFEIVNCP